MTLNYPAEWKFGGIGFPIPDDAHHELIEIIHLISRGTSDAWHVFETFKSAYGVTSSSSSSDWAVTDLISVMDAGVGNAATYIDSYWQAITILKGEGIQVPDAEFINQILRKHGVPLTINPPNLERAASDASLIPYTDAEASGTSTLIPYELVERIGGGGFGTVYRAIKKTSAGEFIFAVKILDPSAFVSDSEPVRERFKREIFVIQQLKHRAIISYVDAGFDQENRPYIVMPLIEGMDLRDATAGRPILETIGLFIEVLNGLNHAHSKGILHRDLKPANILVNESDQQPIILDFGCAHLHGEATITINAVGTPAYIPHEVMENPKLRIPEHDVYACGIILYELIAGRRPEPGNYIPLATANRSTETYYELIDLLIRRAIAPLGSRISTMNELLEATVKLRSDLDKLLNPSNPSAEVAFAARRERFHQSGILKRLEQKREMSRFLHNLIYMLKAKLGEISKLANFSFEMGDTSPHEENGYPAVNSLFSIYLKPGERTDVASNTFRIEDGMYVARFGIEGKDTQEYSRVSVDTPNTFESNVLDYAYNMIGELIDVYMERHK
jgi:serine/threonine protein kinase